MCIRMLELLSDASKATLVGIVLLFFPFIIWLMSRELKRFESAIDELKKAVATIPDILPIKEQIAKREVHVDSELEKLDKALDEINKLVPDLIRRQWLGDSMSRWETKLGEVRDRVTTAENEIKNAVKQLDRLLEK